MNTDYRNSGILMTIPQTDTSKQKSFYCKVVLPPSRGSSIVLSIYKYRIGPNDSLKITKSDDNTISLTGDGDFHDEKKFIISNGKAVIEYRRKTNGESRAKRGFQLTYTTVRNGPCYYDEFRCDNGKCLQQKYVCDGHNHCGDRSNQKTCVPTIGDDQHNAFPERPWQISTYSLAACAVVVSVCIVVVCYLAKKSKANAKTPAPRNNNHNSGENVPLQSVSSEQQQQPPTHVTVAVPSAPPALEHERFSFYDRVRRSLRGMKNSTTKKVPEETVQPEICHVPSLYPNLHQLEPTSEGGVKNPDFKNDE